jgi:two-component system, OmpR family, alkaline phosphatase synthesis response regulator PhoP
MAKVILIVEDDPKSMTLAKDLLEISGYRTIQATDGLEGVELARLKKPDLILMDIMMPKMDGYTACHQIKTNPETKNIPVVMLTAVGHDLNKLLATDMGADGYLTKPLSRQELIDAISPFLKTT